jgi:hypothetical protein
LNPLIEYYPNGLNLKLGENKMKTGIITGIMIVALVALSAGVAAAQYGHGGGGGNGICDNIGTCPEFVDEDGDGICDNSGSGMNFVDEDSDGVCDNSGTNGRDSNGDGIPNGRDDDYEPPRDGSGNGGKNKGHNR